MIPAVLRLAFRVCSGALLPFLLAACVTEVPSPPRVDVPEPGAATAARPAATARRGAARAYPAASPGARAYPAGGGTRAYPAPAPAPAAASAGVPADDTSGITVQSSTETPAGSYPAGDAAVYPAAAPAAADTGMASSAPASAPSAIAIEEGHVPARSPNAAVNALLASADGSRRRGDLGAAVAAAERALRIQPGDPAVYCELALLRLAQGQRELAIQLARKGLAQQPEPDLRARLEDLIARASAASG